MIDYPKNLRKTAIIKRIIISCCIVAIISFTIGGMFGYVFKGCIDEKELLNEEIQTIETELKKGVYVNGKQQKM